MRATRLMVVPAALLLLTSLAGCSGVGKMPIQFDSYARHLDPPAEKALVYVVRPSSMGQTVRFTVTCDGDSIGATGGGRYIYTLQEPGAHLFVSKAENKSELPIVLEAGKTYYLEQQIKMGLLTARANLERLDDVEGREKLEKCSLSEEITEIPPGAEDHMQKVWAGKARLSEMRTDRDKSR